uniref:Uncharacterized protein n=1 Tax=Romanomermis culicivorax TaxID=13658 RepID=A0A915K8N0_ROMCU
MDLILKTPDRTGATHPPTWLRSGLSLGLKAHLCSNFPTEQNGMQSTERTKPRRNFRSVRAGSVEDKKFYIFGKKYHRKALTVHRTTKHPTRYFCLKISTFYQRPRTFQLFSADGDSVTMAADNE